MSPLTGLGLEFVLDVLARAGDREELASRTRHWMDAPIRMVRWRETRSGASSDVNGKDTNFTPQIRNSIFTEFFLGGIKLHFIKQLIQNCCNQIRSWMTWERIF